MSSSYGLFALLCASLLITNGCSKQPHDWQKDCRKHYSLNSREASQCKQKVEDGDEVKIPPEQITLDPENAARQSFDDTGKGGASDAE